jgi:hypothetical protein
VDVEKQGERERSRAGAEVEGSLKADVQHTPTPAFVLFTKVSRFDRLCLSAHCI